MTRPRLHPPTVFLATLLTQIGLAVAMPRPPIALTGVRLGGLATLVAGLAVTALAERRFARFGVPVRPGSKSPRLITGGLNRWSRNPMYLGLVISLVGVAALLASPAALLPATLFFLALERAIRREEAALEARFGAEYSSYKSRVRRWVGVAGSRGFVP